MNAQNSNNKPVGIDPALVAYGVLQVIDIFTRIMSPGYQAPTVEELEALRNRLKNSPALEVFTGDNTMHNILKRIFS